MATQDTDTNATPRHLSGQAAAPTRRQAGGRTSRGSGRIAGNGLLNKNQKARLAQAARKAFDRLHNLGAIESDPGESASAFFQRWRREEQGRAVNQAEPFSLTDARQYHFRPLELHFKTLAGDIGARDFDRAMEAEPEHESTRQLLHHVRTTLREYGLAEGYALSIARSQWQVETLEQLTDHQATGLLATIRRRGAAKRRREARG